jgi:outer membrane protein
MFGRLLRINGRRDTKKIGSNGMGNARPSVKKRSTWVAVGMFACGIVVSLTATESVRAQTADTPVNFDIPAQGLGASLNSIAVQANLQIFFEQDPVSGLEAPAISGTMTAKQALELLLARTSLDFAQNSDGTLVVREKPKIATRRPARKTKPAASVAQVAPEVVAAPVAAAAPQSVRDSEGPWVIRSRVLFVDVDGNSNPRTNDGWGAELVAEYFFNSHWSSEVAVSLAQTHDYSVKAPLPGGTGNIGTFRLMPNFLTVKYNFLPEAAFRPYVGVGLNVTRIYAVHAGAFALSDTTVAPALQAGLDMRLSSHWSLNADLKWARSRPTAEFEGHNIGEMRLDPLLIGVGVAFRFGGSPDSATH